MPDDDEALTAAAEADENAAAAAAVHDHLRNRVVMLNREVRLRDAKIAELRARLEVFEAEDPDEEEHNND